jgi:membrane-bound lytic murein transglycosylase B
MQFMPGTWAAYGEGDVNSDRDAIRAAARYLKANGAPANMANALFRYNNSQRYVRAVTAYAEVMRAEPDAYRGYYHWQVYYLTTMGDILLPVGYGR